MHPGARASARFGVEEPHARDHGRDVELGEGLGDELALLVGAAENRDIAGAGGRQRATGVTVVRVPPPAVASVEVGR
jgi:pantoate kinase